MPAVLMYLTQAPGKKWSAEEEAHVEVGAMRRRFSRWWGTSTSPGSEGRKGAGGDKEQH